MKFSELCEKEVVDISSGAKLGYIDDIIFDERTAQISEMVLCGKGASFRLFTRDVGQRLPWRSVKIFGADTILADAGGIVGES